METIKMNYTHKNKLSSEELFLWLKECDENFKEPRWTDDKLLKYAAKISRYGYVDTLQSNEEKIGLIAYYLNENEEYMFITIISINKNHRGKGLGKYIVSHLIELLDEKYKNVLLEVRNDNFKAKTLYEKIGFKLMEHNGLRDTMILNRHV